MVDTDLFFNEERRYRELPIEARHTICLEISKRRRQRIASNTSIFIPKEICSGINYITNWQRSEKSISTLRKKTKSRLLNSRGTSRKVSTLRNRINRINKNCKNTKLKNQPKKRNNKRQNHQPKQQQHKRRRRKQKLTHPESYLIPQKLSPFLMSEHIRSVVQNLRKDISSSKLFATSNNKQLVEQQLQLATDENLTISYTVEMPKNTAPLQALNQSPGTTKPILDEMPCASNAINEIKLVSKQERSLENICPEDFKGNEQLQATKTDDNVSVRIPDNINNLNNNSNIESNNKKTNNTSSTQSPGTTKPILDEMPCPSNAIDEIKLVSKQERSLVINCPDDFKGNEQLQATKRDDYACVRIPDNINNFNNNSNMESDNNKINNISSNNNSISSDSNRNNNNNNKSEPTASTYYEQHQQFSSVERNFPHSELGNWNYYAYEAPEIKQVNLTTAAAMEQPQVLPINLSSKTTSHEDVVHGHIMSSTLPSPATSTHDVQQKQLLQRNMSVIYQPHPIPQPSGDGVNPGSYSNLVDRRFLQSPNYQQHVDALCYDLTLSDRTQNLPSNQIPCSSQVTKNTVRKERAVRKERVVRKKRAKNTPGRQPNLLRGENHCEVDPNTTLNANDGYPSWSHLMNDETLERLSRVTELARTNYEEFLNIARIYKEQQQQFFHQQKSILQSTLDYHQQQSILYPAVNHQQPVHHQQPVNHQQVQPVNHHQQQPVNHQQQQTVNHQQLQPVNHQQLQPVNHHQQQPVNHQQLQPVNHQQLQPVNHHQQQPVNHQLQPVNHQQQQPVNHQQLQPVIHHQQQPVNHQQQQPVNHQQLQPVNHHQQQPVNHQQQQPVNHQHQQPVNHQQQQPVIHQQLQAVNHQQQQPVNHQHQQPVNNQQQQPIHHSAVHHQQQPIHHPAVHQPILDPTLFHQQQLQHAALQQQQSNIFNQQRSILDPSQYHQQQHQDKQIPFLCYPQQFEERAHHHNQQQQHHQGSIHQRELIHHSQHHYDYSADKIAANAILSYPTQSRNLGPPFVAPLPAADRPSSGVSDPRHYYHQLSLDNCQLSRCCHQRSPSALNEIKTLGKLCF